MRSKTAALSLFLGMLMPFVAGAHDPSKHKGKPTKGEVVSVANDRIEVKTATGTKTFTLTDKTKFERGEQAATRADLKKGDPVTVFGTTLASGEVVAREVLVGKPGGHKH